MVLVGFGVMVMLLFDDGVFDVVVLFELVVLFVLFDGGILMICGLGSRLFWVWFVVWFGVVFGGVGCVVCGIGWLGVLFCSVWFGLNCCGWFVLLLVGGGVIFDMNGDGECVI